MFTLRTLFIVVAVAALGVAAMVSDVYWLMSGFVVVTLGILCWAFLERQNPFWRGLLVFGTVYMVCACVSMFARLAEALPSTWIHFMTTEYGANSDALPLYEPNQFSKVDSGVVAAVINVNKRVVIHCIGALLFGLVGGLLNAWKTKKGN